MLKAHVVAILSIAAYIGVATIHVDWPLVRHDEDGNTRWAKGARNLLRFGYATTRFGALTVDGPSLDAYPNWREHYNPRRPMLPYVVLSGTFFLFGEGEVQMRATNIALGAGAIFIFSLFAAAFGGKSLSAAATPIFALVPLFSYFSTMTWHLTFGLFFILLALYSYWRWITENKRRWLALCCVAVFLGCQSDWPAYFVPFVLAAHCWLTRPELRRRCVLALLAPCAIFALYCFHMWLLEPEHATHLKGLLYAGYDRAVGESYGGYHPLHWMKEKSFEFLLHYTVGVLILAGVGLVAKVKRRSPATLLILLMPLLSLDQILFMPFQAFEDFQTYPLLPTMALLAGQGILALHRHRLVAGVLATAGLAQSGYIAIGYLTQQTPLVAICELAQVANQETRPHDRVLLVSYSYGPYEGYYLDRYADRYASWMKQMRFADGRIEKTDELEIARKIAAATRTWDVAVVADPEALERYRGVLERFRCIDEDGGGLMWHLYVGQLRWQEPIVAALELKASEKWRRNGYRFYRLK